MTIFGDGKQQRAFTHINDIAPIIADSVNHRAARNETFNIGADQPYAVNELARIVAAALGLPCRTLHLDPRNEVKIAFSDHRKAERIRDDVITVHQPSDRRARVDRDAHDLGVA